MNPEPYANELAYALTGRETLMPVSLLTIAQRHRDRLLEDGLIPTMDDRMAVLRIVEQMVAVEAAKLARQLKGL